MGDEKIVEWDVSIVVRLAPDTRRALAASVGRRGLITKKAFEEAVTDLVAVWIEDAMEKADG